MKTITVPTQITKPTGKVNYVSDLIIQLTCLKYGIMVPSGINVPPGKFGKNNNRTPWNKRTPLKIQNMFHKRTLFEEENLSEAIFEGVIDIYLLA